MVRRLSVFCSIMIIIVCLYCYRMYDRINKAIAGDTGGRGALTRRNTIDEEDTVEFDYELDDKQERVVLGKGSFGTVYSAIDMVTKRKMAIKEIPETTSGYVDRNYYLHAQWNL